MDKVTVIMAARNEESRIGQVLEIVSKHPLIDQILVMCDDCSDKTAEVAKKFPKVEIHERKLRLGKTMAVKHALKYVKNEVVLLLDADLQRLTEDNITNLVKPVAEGLVDFTLSLRGNSYGIYKWLGVDFCSGERVIRKELLNDEIIWSKPRIGFGLEVLLNYSLLKRHKKFLSIPLLNLYQTPKSEKVSYLKGTIDDFTMVYNIFKALPFYLVILQFIQMAYLNKKYQKLVRTQLKSESYVEV